MTVLRNKSSNHYCGPAALAALTGVHVDDAAHTLRVVSGKRAIKGTLNRHMVEALSLLGHMALPVPVGQRPTLTQALAGVLKGRQKGQRYLMVITGHYIAIEGRKLVDNKHPEGIALTQCPYRRKRVRALWQVIRN